MVCESLFIWPPRNDRLYNRYIIVPIYQTTSTLSYIIQGIFLSLTILPLSQRTHSLVLWIYEHHSVFGFMYVTCLCRLLPVLPTHSHFLHAHLKINPLFIWNTEQVEFYFFLVFKIYFLLVKIIIPFFVLHKTSHSQNKLFSL